MNTVLSSQKDAKVALGKLLMTLRLGSKTKKMNQLAAKCGVGVNELHKLEGGRGYFPEALIRKILLEVEANTLSLVKADGYLKTIHPSVTKKRVAAATPSFVPAFA